MEHQVKNTEYEEMGWMLQSSQVSDQALIEALVYAHGAEIYRLLSLTLEIIGQTDHRQEAVKLVSNTLAMAAARRRQFWGEPPLRAWLFKITIAQLEAGGRAKVEAGLSMPFRLEALIATDPKAALVVLLSAACGFSISETSAVLDVDQHTASLLLASAYFALAGHLQLPSAGISPEGIAQALAARDEAAGHGGTEDQAENRDLVENRDPRDAALKWIRQVDREVAAAVLNSRLLSSQEQLSQIVATAKAQLANQERKLRAVTITRQAAFLMLALAVLAWLFRPGGPLTTEPTPTSRPLPTPITRVTPTPLPDNMFYFNYRIQPGDTLNSIAERVGVPAQTVVELNHLTDPANLSPSQELRLPYRIIFPESRPSLPAPLPPLTIQSTAEEVISRITNTTKYWDSLWMTTQTYSYGSPGYFGPPLSSSWTQVWIRQPSLALVAQMYPGSDSFRTELQTDHMMFTRWTANFPPSGAFQEEGQELVQQFSTGLREWEPEQITILGTSKIAGRDVIEIERQAGQESSSLDRYWVDAETGFVLRQQRLDAVNGGLVLWETVVSEIVYNVDLPAKTFITGLMELNWLTRDFQGASLPFDELPPSFDWTDTVAARAPRTCDPPAGNVDPSREPVILAWRIPGLHLPECDASPEPGENESRISIFTGSSYLGSMSLETETNLDLAFQSCSRSPDGRRIAVMMTNSLYEAGSTYLYWIDLAQPLDVRPAISGTPSNLPALFAPDSRRIAISNCVQRDCGITIFDTKTGEEAFLSLGENHYLSHFQWSPDGKALGVIFATFVPGRSFDPAAYTLKVIDAGTGDELYASPFSWESWEGGALPAGSPVEEWGNFLQDESEIGCLRP